MKTQKIINRVLVLAIIIGVSVFLLLATVQCAQTRNGGPAGETPLEKIPFDGTAAYGYLRDLCAIGPRPTGSDGMIRQQQFLEEHFQKCGARAEYQRFQFPHPQNGSPVAGVNMILRWKPERKERILLCAHYDTLPLPLLDPPGSNRPFVGAEDNASGVALLMQLAKTLPETLDHRQTRYGVDIVLLDAEEYMFQPHGRFCIGSEFFAREYAKAAAGNARGYSYACGILLDMIGQHGVQLLKERNSYQWPDTRPIVNEVWNMAKKLGVREFRSRLTPGEILDDHVMLHNLGGIPVIDIIDLDYAPWHTSQDVPEQCSPLSLARVGWVVSEWLAEKK